MSKPELLKNILPLVMRKIKDRKQSRHKQQKRGKKRPNVK